MHIHILGVSGTYMAGIALIAKDLGHKVTGHDQCCYSPMKEQLLSSGIEVTLGYDDISSLPQADLFLIGNVIKRGNPLLEEILKKDYTYSSAPEWLRTNVLNDKWVLAVAGTHGKTTTTAILVWLLEQAGLNPGFLVGGMLQNFGISARNTQSKFFVIEADEYDTAYFDKRPKFLHYKPKTLIINNLEFDHADIYSDLDAVKKQFGYLLKTVPANGRVVFPKGEENITSLLAEYNYAEINTTSMSDSGADWLMEPGDNYQSFSVNGEAGSWQLQGEHNSSNLLAAIAAASHVGVKLVDIMASISSFKSVKRRLELKGIYGGVKVYDDFGHHPTAIAAVLKSLGGNAFAVLDMGAVAYTLRSGAVSDDFKEALTYSSRAFVVCGDDTDTKFNWKEWGENISGVDIYNNPDIMVKNLLKVLKAGDTVICFGSKDLAGVFKSLERELGNIKV